MGLLFKSRRRSGGGNILTLVLLLGGGFYVLSRYGDAMQTTCMDKVQGFGGVGAPICDGIGKAVALLRDGFSGSGNYASGAWEEKLNDMRVSFDNANIRDRFRGAKEGFYARIDESLASYVSMDTVQQMMSGGGASFGNSPRNQLGGALSSVVAGRALMGGASGVSANPMAALDVYKQGAEGAGAFGLLPQMELGSIYASGAGGIDPNLGQALHYNSEALSSLSELRGSTTPEAQTALQGLNMDPSELQMRLEAVISELKEKMQQ